MAAAEPALDHAARLERACRAEAWDVRELVCLLREAVGRDDAKAAEDALCTLHAALELPEEEKQVGELASHKPRLLEVAAADGAVAVLTAVQAFGLKTVGVVSSACFVLGELSLLEESDAASTARAACAAAARIALRAPPASASNLDVEDLLLAGMCDLFRGAFANNGNAELAAEALAAGAVERLLAGCALGRGDRAVSFWALELLCACSYHLPTRSPDVALRIAEAGGLDAIFAAMAETHKDSPDSIAFTIADKSVDLLLQLLKPTMSSLEEPHVRMVPLLRDRDDDTLKHLLMWLAGHARDTARSAGCAVRVLITLSWIGSELDCKPALARAATDAVVDALRALQHRSDWFDFLAASAYAINSFSGWCGEADADKPGTYALHAGALPPLEASLATLDADDVIYDGIEEIVLKLRGVRADAAMAELLAEEEAEAAARKPKAGKGAKSKAKAKASKNKAAAAASKSALAKDSTAAPAAEALPAPAPPAPAPAPPQPEAAPPPSPPSPPQPPLPPWLLQAMQQPAPAPPAPVAAHAVQPAAPRGARPPNIAAALAATRISPPAAVPSPVPRWDVAPSPPPAQPAGAWGRARPAIPGLSAGEVPRELECAICLDARAEGRTACCGQTAFCAACAATLRGECPLCRASR